MSDVPPESSLREALARDIEALERRVNRPKTLGISPLVGFVGCLLCGLMLYAARGDLLYFYSNPQVYALGGMGRYAPGPLPDNRYVEVQGVPASRASYAQVSGRDVVVVGLLESPFLLMRPLLPGEVYTRDRPPPPPDSRPFTAQGRLLSEASAARFSEAFKQARAFGQVEPRYLIVEGERPRTDFTAVVWGGFLVTALLFNAWVLVRGLLARRPVRD